MHVSDKTTNKLKKLGIISIVLFAFITTLSLYFYKSCNSLSNCDLAFTNTVSMFIIGAGIIGLIYGFIMLRGLDNKIDNSILKDYEEIMLSNNEKIDSTVTKKI